MTYGADRTAPDLSKPPAPTGEAGAGRTVMAIAAAVLILLAAAFPIYVILFTLSEGRAPVLGTPPVAAVATPPAAPPPAVVPEEEAAAPPAVDPSEMVGGLLDRLDDLLAPLTR